MAKKKKPQKKKDPAPAPLPFPLFADDQGEHSQEELNALWRELQELEPELFADMMAALSEWAALFREEHGREPNEADISAVITQGLPSLVSLLMGEEPEPWDEDEDDDEFEDLSWLAEMDFTGEAKRLPQPRRDDQIATPPPNAPRPPRRMSAQLRRDLGFDRSPQDWGLDPTVDPRTLTGYCAWCGRRTDPDSLPFVVGARLRFHLEHDRKVAAVYYLPLTAYNRLLPAILVTAESMAAKDGWDLIIAGCGQPCLDLIRGALHQETDLAERLLLN